jgi:Ni,Fe-hydrogenase III large subunit/Ni,Fe-hydrogenase III component G
MTIRRNTTEQSVEASGLAPIVEVLLRDNFRVALVACHHDEDAFRIVYVLVRLRDDQRVELTLRSDLKKPAIPSLAALNFSVSRFEREVRDLYGVVPLGHTFSRRLVRHAHWPKGYYPMRHDLTTTPRFEPDVGSFPFIQAEGTGIYEIPVGPVHAGIIEPGHFRFSVVGETILRMKSRLWFVHRGIEKIFEGMRPSEGVGLAEQISGDTAVGHGLAFAIAVEEANGIEVSEEDRVIRAMLLELERLYNHISDLGALANDVGYSIINVHALRLREELMRANKLTTGHRLLRGGISIGGAHLLNLPDLSLISRISDEVKTLVDITLDNATLRDRFSETAVLSRASAEQIGTLGYVARASGLETDARQNHPFLDLGESFKMVVEENGDVMARYQIRVREIDVSLRMISELTRRLENSHGSGLSVECRTNGAGLGLVEGWRGTIAHRVELGANGELTRVKVVDPSFFNWPALSVALAGTIVPDFPLTNKSFNLSYAGNDL